jgi:hypothetical protein
MELRNLVLLIVSFLTLGVNAQFGFFDQMFNGGQQQQQQQQQQNVRSDSQWYQSNYESGTSSRIAPLPHLPASFPKYPKSARMYVESVEANPTQRTATNTSAPARSPACTSRTTAPAPGRPSRTKLSWARGSACVRVRAGGRRGRRRGRLSWRGRGCCDEIYGDLGCVRQGWHGWILGLGAWRLVWTYKRDHGIGAGRSTRAEPLLGKLC